MFVLTFLFVCCCNHNNKQMDTEMELHLKQLTLDLKDFKIPESQLLRKAQIQIKLVLHNRKH